MLELGTKEKNTVTFRIFSFSSKPEMELEPALANTGMSRLRSTRYDEHCGYRYRYLRKITYGIKTLQAQYCWGEFF